MTRPRVEILVVTGDEGNDFTIWVDGETETTADVIICEVDPGRGWLYDDWVESAVAAAATFKTEAAKQAVIAAYADPPGKKYIDGWPEEDR